MQSNNLTQNLTRADAIDRETFIQMFESRPFALLQARIAAELKRAEENCVRADDVLDLRRAQGAVLALRSVLTMPARMLDEMRPKK